MNSSVQEENVKVSVLNPVRKSFTEAIQEGDFFLKKKLITIKAMPLIFSIFEDRNKELKEQKYLLF